MILVFEGHTQKRSWVNPGSPLRNFCQNLSSRLLPLSPPSLLLPLSHLFPYLSLSPLPLTPCLSPLRKLKKKDKKLFLVGLGNRWDAGDRQHLGCMQGKCFTHCAIADPAQCIKLSDKFWYVSVKHICQSIYIYII